MATKYLVCGACNYILGQGPPPKHTWWGELICPVCNNRNFFETTSIPHSKSGHQKAPQAAELKLNTASGNGWYFAESKQKKLTQIVITVNPGKESESQFGSLALASKYSSLTQHPLATGLFRLESRPGPYLMVRTDNLVEQIKQMPLQIGFSFFRMPSGGLFTIYVESPVMKDKLKNPFLEMGYGLDESDITDRINDTLSKDTLEIVLSGEGGMFGLQCKYDIVHPLEDSCRAILKQEWQQLLRYHRSVGRKNFQQSMNELWSLMPEDESPILKLIP